MNIVIAGGTGFLGRPLAAALAADGHDVVILTRGDGPRRGQTRSRAVAWTPDGDTGPWAAEIDGAGAVVNLAGESIAGQPLERTRRSSGFSTAACTRRAASSRQSQARRSAAAGVRQRIGRRLLRPARRRGRHGGHAAPAPISWPTVCVQWEAEAMRAASDRTRVVCIRTGPRARDATAARCRRCCRRSGSAPADRSDRAVSTGRGFIAPTGSRWCSWAIRTPAAAGAAQRAPRRTR